MLVHEYKQHSTTYTPRGIRKGHMLGRKPRPHKRNRDQETLDKLNGDPAYRLHRARSLLLLAVILIAGGTLFILGSRIGAGLNRQIPAQEDPLRRGASDYGCNLSRSWFTWDADKPDQRGNALKAFNPAWDSRLGWNGQGKQTVAYTTSPKTTKLGNSSEYEVTCGVFFSDPAIPPIFDTVRVLSNEKGGYSPTSLPVPISSPEVPVPGQDYLESSVVRDLQAPTNVSSAVTSQSKAYMDAWGKGNTTVLQGLVAPGFSPAPLSGGLVLASAEDVSDIKVYQNKDHTRTYADMKVRWTNNVGSAVEANYRLDFVEKDGRWVVSKVDTTVLNSRAYVNS